MKKLAVTFLLVFMLAASISAAPTPAVLADEVPPDTIVLSTGEMFEAPNVSETMTYSPGSEGGGELAPEAEQQISAAELAAAPSESYFEGESAESIIGADGRIKVTHNTTFPYRAIAKLVVHFGTETFGCTGWYFGADDMMTAGHCVYDQSLGWATSIEIYPGRKGSITPYGSDTAQFLGATCGWTGIGACTPGQVKYDYGYIQTTGFKGNTVGWFGVRWQTTNNFPGNYVVDGYPGDKAFGTQWKMSGPITHVTNTRQWYKMDTFGGQSGGPVFNYLDACGGACAAGIHTYGTGMSPYAGTNSANRITHDVYNNIIAWGALPH